MAVPEFVLALRRHVGHAPLWLPGVTAVVRRPCDRGTEVLLVRRSDNGRWAPVTGIVDPGEQPAAAAARETLEETGVRIRVDRLASVAAHPLMAHPNGDLAHYLDHTFACTWLEGEPYAADEESTEAVWWSVNDLPPMEPAHRERIDVVLVDDPTTRFVL
ncbi:NUDIX domain-containing protein [Microlunatus capsulatus]|uniref:ADP-ribose pyrophosphatase YjhB (NUDIX family) n=1 Tax=Microlunatus capsulatus TaxID=99117 RepID=A0ABS4Z2V6_9ACTN|nr:NUDIX domain-containing protein [Microlunatus capsulatus]MBP2415382.1 ADP-ribose pyrophosphatase YjhB (NUDIX family) [Microlunatus capsulatus]